LSFAKIALRNLPRRKLRNALTLTAIMLGVMLLIGVNVAADSAMYEFKKYLDRTWGEIDILIVYGNGEPFGQGNVTLVRNVTGVAECAQRLNWHAAINNDTEKMIGITGIDTATDFVYKGYNITGSTSLEGNKVVVSESLYEDYNLTIGGVINVTTNAFGSDSWNRTYRLQIVGVYHPEQEQAWNYVYMDLTQSQNISSLTNKVSHIFVKVTDVGKTIEVRDDLREILGFNFDVTAPKVEDIQKIQSRVHGFKMGINIATMVSIIVCTFLVFNTMFMRVSERKYEIGVLRALGASRRQIFWMLFNEGIFLGIVGTVLGILVGFGFSKAFMILMQRAFGREITSFVLTPTHIILGIMAGLMTVIFGALYPAVKACRISVIQAIRPSIRDSRKGISNNIILLMLGAIVFLFGVLQTLTLIPAVFPLDIILVLAGAIVIATAIFRKIIPQLDSALSRISPSLGRLVSRNVSRKMLRSAVCFSIIGISLSFMVLMGGVESGLTIAMEQGIRDAFGADILLIANQSVPTSFVDNLTDMAEVESATPISAIWRAQISSDTKNRTVGVIVIDPETFPDLTNYEFVSPPSSEMVFDEMRSNNETLMLPRSLADELEVEANQTLSILTVTPSSRTNFTVAGIFTGAGLQFIYWTNRPISECIFISFDSQKTYFHGEYKAIVFLVNVEQEYKGMTSQVLERIETEYPEYGFEGRSKTLDDIVANVRVHINRVFLIFLTILYFTVLITILGITVTMVMNVTERRREIGILRSQGMSRRQVLTMILTEALIIGIVGFAIGLPCGLLLLKGMTNTMTVMGFWFPFITPWIIIIQAFLLAMAAAIAGAIYPAYKASKINIVEALRVE
jgi:putative ABC transport system permease protein